MSSSVSEKIKQIREAENLGRAEFAERVGISKNTLIGIERQGRDPRAETVQKVGRAFPQYAFWLVTDQTHVEAGHLKPEKVVAKKANAGSKAGKSRRK